MIAANFCLMFHLSSYYIKYFKSSLPTSTKVFHKLLTDSAPLSTLPPSHCLTPKKTQLVYLEYFHINIVFYAIRSILQLP